MTITFGDVRSWRAAPLGRAGDGIKDDLTALERAQEQLESQGVPESWEGLAVWVARGRRDALVQRLGRHISGKEAMRRALYDAETLVSEVERRVTDVEGEAAAHQFTIGSDGSVTDTSTPPTFDHRFEAEEWSRARQARAQGIADEVAAILGRAAAADATLAGGIPSGHVDHVDDYGVPSPETAEEWARMTDAERRAVVEEYTEELAEEAGIDNPTIVWEPPTWDLWGQWRDGDGEMAVREDLLDDPFVLNTVAHEMRHARQFEAIRDENDLFHAPWNDDPFTMHEEDGITREQAETWDENFDDYQSTSNGDTYEEYFEQPVEVDARRSGKEGLEGMTPEELERLTEEGLE